MPTASENSFLAKLQQPAVEEVQNSVSYSFEDKITALRSTVKEAKLQLRSVQGHLNALEDASKQLKDKYLDHQHSYIELNNILNWFDILDELIIMLRSGTPLLQLVNHSFDHMFKEVDQCNIYLHNHPDYKLSAEYSQTTRTIITKALTLYSMTFGEYLQTIVKDVKSIPTAQSNFENHLESLCFYTKPFHDKLEDVEFRQIFEDAIDIFLEHRNASLRPLFVNLTLDKISQLNCVSDYSRTIKSFLVQETNLFVNIFGSNFISYSQLYTNLIQISTKHILEYIAESDDGALLEIRLLLNSELIASDLDSKAKLILLEGFSDLSNFLNKN
eukprot:NODE_4_length_77007_cov_1.156642.p26 type:complete len:330 gc:universal NODE_4_length_77007_cov_1.156642:33050-34039(+)